MSTQPGTGGLVFETRVGSSLRQASVYPVCLVAPNTTTSMYGMFAPAGPSLWVLTEGVREIRTISKALRCGL